MTGIPVLPMRFIRIWSIWSSYNPDYVLILSGDHIYKMDYEVMLKYHKANNADVTIACMPVPIEEASRFGIVITDDDRPDHRVRGEAGANPRSNLASMGIYIFSWRALKEALIAMTDRSRAVTLVSMSSRTATERDERTLRLRVQRLLEGRRHT